MGSAWTGNAGAPAGAVWKAAFLGALSLVTALEASSPKGTASARPRPQATREKSVAAADSTVFHFVPPVPGRRDSLFIAAATGEPRFQPLRDSAAKVLIAEDTATLEYLLAERLRNQTPRQRHYVEYLFQAVSDSGRNHAPVTLLAEALSGAPDSIQVQLLHIGSELDDSSFLPVAKRYLEADSVEVRKTAMRSLGTYPDPGNVPLILKGMDKTRDLERQVRLWALDKQDSVGAWPKLIPLLEDGKLYNRQLARRIIARSAGDWAPLDRYVPADPEPEDLLEWVLLALETPGQAAKAFVRKSLPDLDPETREFIESILPRTRRHLPMSPAKRRAR